MNTLKTKIQVVRAQNIVVTDNSITVDLDDRRTISAPLAWYPRLLHGKPDLEHFESDYKTRRKR
ncbi:MAG: DUF2442 domain-containing protein [Planctomycetes bacterium]|nr:DUF2442 domain-containing protein [Planctomycetota bacterium]MBM4066321.1 DUF2442 domain-containing protein [Planctomycetota bacterium]